MSYAVYITNNGYATVQLSKFINGEYFNAQTGEVWPQYMQENPKGYFFADQSVAYAIASRFNEIG